MFIFFFFKQKTAYEMRISDWSSDVCSSDLDHAEEAGGVAPRPSHGRQAQQVLEGEDDGEHPFGEAQRLVPARLQRRNAVQQHHRHAGQDAQDQQQVEIALARRVVVVHPPVQRVAPAGIRRGQEIALEDTRLRVLLRRSLSISWRVAARFVVPLRRHPPVSRNASRPAARVRSITSSSCALDMKPASNADGARYTPRSSMAWKKRLNAAL